MAYLLGGLERDRDWGRIGIQAACSAFDAALLSAIAMSCQPSSFRNTICPVVPVRNLIGTRLTLRRRSERTSGPCRQRRWRTGSRDPGERSPRARR